MLTRVCVCVCLPRAGMKVVIVPCDKDGNIDVAELRKKAEEVRPPPTTIPLPTFQFSPPYCFHCRHMYVCE